jgi:hypothetical protein
MQTSKFNKIPDFSAHVLFLILKYIGVVGGKRVATIADNHDKNFENVLHYIKRALEVEMNVPVYIKENTCTHSKSVTIAVYWSSRWIYLSFYKSKKNINVIVIYRANKIEGVHTIWNQYVADIDTDI